MNNVLLRTAARLGAWAIGLPLAAWVVPGVSVTVPGFLFAVIFFLVTQTLLSLPILKLPHGYASLALGTAALAMTFVSISLASVFTGGISIDGFAPWLATALLVWLLTTISAVLLPDVYFPRPLDETDRTDSARSVGSS